ncbi:MAG: hypothetical protein WBL68_17790 [Nitrososphaeraceae archaeon]
MSEYSTSISSRAFELYSQLKSLLEAAISMGLEAEVAIRYWWSMLTEQIMPIAGRGTKKSRAIPARTTDQNNQ